MKKEQKSGFSGRLGYILAVAGSAVGLGNIWRFPYLAAKYGGGIFLLVYLLLVVTFGYAMIVSETALGRMTGKSPVGAFAELGKGLFARIGGWLNAIVPILIAPYYCVIGGWVAKYLFEYLRGGTHALAQDAYFGAFTQSPWEMEFWFLAFAAMTLAVILGGVKAGVERVSKVMMPLLIVLAMVVAGYSVTRPGAMEGVKYLFVPDFSSFSLMTVVAAMGQMFYSLSIAMGVLYTYGSYISRDVDIEKSTMQIELFDTAIAILAGLMIIPAVFAFSGGEEGLLQSGPSLMFVTIPKVFDSMGMGQAAGVVFFLLVLFAALTSSISLAETSAATFQEELGWSRRRSTLLVAAIIAALGTLCALGFNVLDFVKLMGMSFLDFFDFLTNSLMMPIAALFTCVLVARVVSVRRVEEEVMQSSAFKRRGMYAVCIRYIAPLCLIVILLSAVASVLGLIKI